MDHGTGLISTIALGFGLALVFGLIAVRFKFSPLVGYLLAGVALSPFTPGVVGNTDIAVELAEIGVILLMFGVGLHFSVSDLLAVKRISLPGAVVQIGTATVLGAVAAMWWGWSWGEGLVFGLSLSVASTVVLLRALEDRGSLTSVDGRIAVGWLIVEDLAMVLALVLLPALAVPLGGTSPEGSDTHVLIAILFTSLKVVAFGVLMYVVGRRVVPWLLAKVASKGSRELFTLALLALSLGIAVGASELFDISLALGAFFAGVVIAESDMSQRAASEALPFQDAFAVLFFVSVGMLFDPAILIDEPLKVFSVVLIIIFGKSIAAFVIVLLFRYPLHSALTIAASLAQIGEFSFILAGVAHSLALLPDEAENLILAGALISISLNPLIFNTNDKIGSWIKRSPRLLGALERPSGPLADLPETQSTLSNHVILVGHGGVGAPIAEALATHDVPFVVIDENREVVQELRERDIPAIYGDITRPGILGHAHIDRARLLVISVGDSADALVAFELARQINPAIEAIVRTHSEEERIQLERIGVSAAVVAERELALAIAQYVIDKLD